MALKKQSNDRSDTPDVTADADDELEGPFDIEDFDDPSVAALARLDLGSVLIPMPEGGQVQVELSNTGVPSAIWLVTANGRFTIAAYAAPKSAGLWREVASELADSLRKDTSTVNIEDGPWGREVVGVGAENAGAVRFIGVDGYRWMIRCVASGPHDRVTALVAQARDALADTVVRRGDIPMPVRTPLPIQLPEAMAAQLRAATEQAAEQQAAASGQPQAQPQQQARPQPPEQQQPTARRGTPGSAMQQLRTITGG